MEPLLGIGVLFKLGVDAVVGVRLLALSRRTRELPELALGCAFVLLGTFGYPLAILARRGVAGPEASDGLLLTALFFQNLACLAIYVVDARVFHARAVWSWPAVGLVTLGLCASFGIQISSGRVDEGPGYALGLALRAGAFAWGAAASLATHGRLRRRLALGLADPLVTDRLRLWGVANATILAGFAAFAVGHRFGGAAGALSPPVLAVTSLSGLGAGVAIWLAFVPPAAYVRRVVARAA